MKKEFTGGIIVIGTGENAGIYHYDTEDERRDIVKKTRGTSWKELEKGEDEKARVFYERAVAENERTRFPKGYIAVKNPGVRGAYPYCSEDERLALMHTYHKYSIQDFPAYQLLYSAKLWAGEKVKQSTAYFSGCHTVLGQIHEQSLSALFTGVISGIDGGRVSFEVLSCSAKDFEETCEENVVIYDFPESGSFEAGMEISFYGEVFEYLTEDGNTDYGIWDIVIK